MRLNWKMVSVLLLLCGTMSVFPVSSDPVYDDWAYQKEIEVQENSGEELVDFQVLVSLDSSNFEFTKANPDGSDLRFVVGEEELSYWIEDWDAEGANARIWVKVPIIPTGGVAKVLMFYGNEAAGPTSDGDAAFEFFDDFESGNLDKWEESSGWNISTDAYQGSNSAYATGKNYKLYKSLDTLEMEEGVLEGMFKFDETTQYHYPYLPNSGSRGPYFVIAKADGNFGYWTGSGPLRNIEEMYEASKWYDIRVKFSYHEKRWWVYIDGKLTTPSGLDSLKGTIIEGLQHISTASSGSGGMYVDVSRVRKYASIEPTITIDSDMVKYGTTDSEAAVVRESPNKSSMGAQSYANRVTDIALNSATLHPQLRQFIY